MADATLSGAEFKKQLRAGAPKMGLFVNSHSPTVAEQLAHSGLDWLLVDTQHGPMNYEKLSAMLSGIANGGAKSMVRVGGYDDRPGIQQALDLGADGVLVPYINTAEEARQAISCTKYPTVGTRSVYFPQRSMNKGGLLGYAGGLEQRRHHRAAGRDRLLHRKHRRDRRRPRRRHSFPRTKRSLHVDGPLQQDTSSRTCTLRPNSGAATQKLVDHARKNNVILGTLSCSAPRASASSWRRGSPSSASGTTCITC